MTVVAEAAYQDRLWRPNLEPLTGLAHLRVIRCTTSAATARDRIARRAAHADQELLDAITAGRHSLEDFVPISLDAPTLLVDTTDGYRPGLNDIIAFTQGRQP